MYLVVWRVRVSWRAARGDVAVLISNVPFDDAVEHRIGDTVGIVVPLDPGRDRPAQPGELLRRGQDALFEDVLDAQAQVHVAAALELPALP